MAPETPQKTLDKAVQDLSQEVKNVPVQNDAFDFEVSPLHAKAVELKEQAKKESKTEVLKATKNHIDSLKQTVAAKQAELKELHKEKPEATSENLNKLAAEIEETHKAVSEKLGESAVIAAEVEDLLPEKDENVFNKIWRSMGKVLDFLKKGGMSVLKLFGFVNEDQAKALAEMAELASVSPQVKAQMYSDVLGKKIAVKFPGLKILPGSKDAEMVSNIENDASKEIDEKLQINAQKLKQLEASKPEPPTSTDKAALETHSTAMAKYNKDVAELIKVQKEYEAAKSQAIERYLDQLAKTYSAKMPADAMNPKEKYGITLAGIMNNQRPMNRKALKGTAPAAKPDENRR